MFHVPSHKNVTKPAGQILGDIGMAEASFHVETVEEITVPPVEADFSFTNYGSICILTALTELGNIWVDEHLPDDVMRHGQFGYVIEPRCAGPILEGIVNDGLVLA